MSLSDINDPQFVLSAIEECDRVGREAFLAKYGFGAARAYWLVHNGESYDSKAILGVAHKYAKPDIGALGAHDFVGGENTVRRKLIELGFNVEVTTDGKAAGVRTSDWLSPGEIYTREDLKEQFDITDATINRRVIHMALRNRGQNR